MSTVFLLSAVVGCTLLLLQTILQVIGLGHDAIGEIAPDADIGDGMPDSPDTGDGATTDHHHDSAALSKIIQFLSYQTIVAFLAFFGLAGLAALQADMSPTGSGILATAAGCLSMVVITYILKGFRGLERDGSFRIHRTIGRPGRVYLRIPAENAGIGKVTISVQGRTVELAAKTTGETLPTGTPVVVRRILDSQTVEVAIADREFEPTGQAHLADAAKRSAGN